MCDMGWIAAVEDDSSGDSSNIRFAICEDQRDVKKRKETYKKHFIREAAKRFSKDLKLGNADIPARFKTNEYKQAVRELQHEHHFSDT